MPTVQTLARTLALTGCRVSKAIASSGATRPHGMRSTFNTRSTVAPATCRPKRELSGTPVARARFTAASRTAFQKSFPPAIGTTTACMQVYPEAKVIHNANTAMAMGSVEAQIAASMEKEIFSTGWGGTGLALEAIRRGELDATPMRMGDDVGATTAEAISADMEEHNDELPFVFLGRITVAHDQMSVDKVDALEQEAFRFSGVGALKR